MNAHVFSDVGLMMHFVEVTCVPKIWREVRRSRAMKTAGGSALPCQEELVKSWICLSCLLLATWLFLVGKS